MLNGLNMHGMTWQQFYDTYPKGLVYLSPIG